MSDLRRAAETLRRALTGDGWQDALARLDRRRLLSVHDALLELLQIVLDAVKQVRERLQAHHQVTLSFVDDDDREADR